MIIEQKQDLRRKMLKERSLLHSEFKAEYDQKICDALLERTLENNYKVVHVYLPMGMEVNIEPYIKEILKRNITVVAPKTLSKPKLQNLVLKSINDLEQGVFGTKHPANGVEYNGKYDFIVVPGLAYDKKNGRLGYGGAYYDTFLKDQNDALKIGVFYSFQEVEELPIESHDVVLDEILTV